MKEVKKKQENTHHSSPILMQITIFISKEDLQTRVDSLPTFRFDPTL